MIPKHFTLVNRKWMVRKVTTKQLQYHLDTHPSTGHTDAGGLLGLCDRDANRIFINKDEHRTDREMEATFWHEFFHAFRYAKGIQDHDDDQVDLDGGIMHQFVQTQRGEV